MVSPLTKKQNDFSKISQLYQYFTSPKHTFRNKFQDRLNQLSTKPLEIGIALAKIRDEGILNLENFSLILMHPSPVEIASGLIQLYNSNLLNIENKKALERHISPTGIALLLRLLQSVKLLSSENRNAIQEKNDPHSVASVLFKLFYAELFTQENFDSVLMHPNLKPIINKLSEFNRQNSLTQRMFEQLMCSQQQQQISFFNDLNELRTITILPKQISNASLYPCHTNFFSIDRQHDSESHSKTVKYNRQICKN
ncbi:MAG TPA: hypothetical protein VGH95_01400 [Candidatus Aquirickettsiella sp.]|jgi:hypothetical protein